MADRPVPYSWEGRWVVASIVESLGYTADSPPPPLQGVEREGLLEEVSDLGILASLVVQDEEDEEEGEVEEGEVEEEEEVPVSAFYPWSTVLSLRPLD